MTQATVKGYSLCLDVEDKDIRIHNRANIMANIFEDNKLKEASSNTSGRGMYLLTQYMEGIPKEERAEALSSFYRVMKQRGYNHAD